MNIRHHQAGKYVIKSKEGEITTPYLKKYQVKTLFDLLPYLSINQISLKEE